jgi:hypothetical protein
MDIHRSICAVCALLTLGWGGWVDPPTGRIVVTLTDNAGRPIAGATVTATDDTGLTLTTAPTDATGRVTLDVAAQTVYIQVAGTTADGTTLLLSAFEPDGIRVELGAPPTMLDLVAADDGTLSLNPATMLAGDALPAQTPTAGAPSIPDTSIGRLPATPVRAPVAPSVPDPSMGRPSLPTATYPAAPPMAPILPAGAAPRSTAGAERADPDAAPEGDPPVPPPLIALGIVALGVLGALLIRRRMGGRAS